MLRCRMPDRPWSEIAIDFLGPLPSGHSLLVLIDYFSRFTEVIVMKQTTADLTINALFETFSRFGVPETLRSDNGPQFISESFRIFCREFGIEHQKTTPYWPQANGEVERMNNTILKRLRISQEQNKDNWKWDLRSFLLMYNSTPHSVTGVAPSALMFGRVLRDKIPSIHNTNKSWIEGTKDHDWERKITAAEASDHRRQAVPSKLGEGDIVVAKRITKENKLSSNYTAEKFQIINREGSEAEIRSMETGATYRRNIAHLKRIEEPVQAENLAPAESPPEANQPLVPVTEGHSTTRRSQRDIERPRHLKHYVQSVLDQIIK